MKRGINDSNQPSKAMALSSQDRQVESNNNPRKRKYEVNNKEESLTLKKLNIDTKEKSESEYNPYIHGTNSSMLLLLDRTEFEMINSVDMLEKYNVAPMGGEITNGGLSNPSAKCNPCFGQLNPKDKTNYNLDTIKQYATEISLPSAKIDLNELNDILTNKNLKLINVLIVLLARIKQYGLFNTEIYQACLIYQKEFHSHVQSCLLSLLIGKYIDIDLEVLNTVLGNEKSEFAQVPENTKIGRWIESNYSFRKISERLINRGLNIEEIVTNPSRDVLLQILNLLEIPENKELSLPAFNPFKLREHPSEHNIYHSYVLYRMQVYGNCDGISEKPLSNFIARYVNNIKSFLSLVKNPNDITKEMASESININALYEKKVINYINACKDCEKLLSKVINNEVNPLTDKQLAHLEKPFPMILISENESNFERVSDEFRAKKPLKLGEDIKKMAVFNEEDRFKAMHYLENNHRRNIAVVTVKDLETSQKTKKSPSSPYLHDDGFPRLSWLAAKNISDATNLQMAKQKERALIADAVKYRQVKPIY